MSKFFSFFLSLYISFFNSLYISNLYNKNNYLFNYKILYMHDSMRSKGGFEKCYKKEEKIVVLFGQFKIKPYLCSVKR